MKTLNFSEYIDLSHVLSSGMMTFPGCSDLEIDSRGPRIPNGSLIDSIRMLGTTSTYIDAPYHVDEQGTKISDYSLEKLINLPVIIVSKPESRRAFLLEDVEGMDVAGKAVLFHTGNDRRFGSEAYKTDAPYLATEVAVWLADNKASLAGIDSCLVDNVDHPEEVPVHKVLLSQGVVIAENMRNIDLLVGKKAYLTAVPPKVEMGSFPARIFASIIDPAL